MWGHETSLGTRKLWLLAIAATCLLLPAVASAKQPVGLDRDRTFGHHGRAIAALDFGPPRFWYAVRVYSAITQQGDVLVVGTNSDGVGAQMVRFLPDGKPDVAFGRNGILRIDAVDDSEFQLTDMTVDSQGRIILAGNSGSPEHAVLMRLRPNGSPDAHFGGGDGVASPEFGIPQMRVSPIEPEPPRDSPVFVGSIDIDTDGRIIVAGSAARFEGGYCLVIRSGMVGRLTSDGSVDTTFGSGGTVVYEPDVIDSVPGLALDRSGAPIIWGQGENCRTPTKDWQITRLSPEGQADLTFGQEGHVWLAGGPDDIAVDRFGRTLFLEPDSVHRLLPSGRLDPHFGHNGGVALRLNGKWSGFHSLAVTPNGGVLATGVQVHHHKPATPQRRLVLASLTAGGKPMQGFGTSGIVKLRSGLRINAAGRQVMTEAKGRVIVVGTIRDPRLATGQGIVLYRFDPGGR